VDGVGDVALSVVAKEDLTMVGYEFQGNLGESGILGLSEGGWFYDRKKEQRYFQGIIGAEYGFENGWTVSGEYYRNGWGETEPSRYRWEAVEAVGVTYLAQNYLGIAASYPYHPLVTLTFSAIDNLDDGSGFGGLGIDYSLGDESRIGIGGNLFAGDENSEFGAYDSIYYLTFSHFF